METLKLSHLLEINGQRVREIEYDTSKLTVAEYRNVLKRLKPAPGTMTMAPNDYEFHFELGKEIIVASNPTYAPEDLDRLICDDIWKVQAVGMRFFGGSPEEQQESNSGEPSDDIPSGSTPLENI